MAGKKRNTKLPTIRQLPSGSYHAQVYIGKDSNGKRQYESITDYDYSKVLIRAAEVKADRKQNKIDQAAGIERMTLREAMAKYIETYESLCSPSTVRSYLSIQRNCLKLIMDTDINDLTQEMIVQALMLDKKRVCYKTLKNIKSLLTLTLKEYRREFSFNVDFGRKTEKNKNKNEIIVPTEDEVRALMAVSKGTVMEIPVMLCACCGLRPCEISALQWRDFDFEKGTLSIIRDVVRDKNNKYVEKGTKSDAGTRVIRLFPQVLASMKENRDRCQDLCQPICIKPGRITDNFRTIRKKAGVRYMRFYDLRHYLVSVMVSMNIPYKYISDYVGHEDEKTTKRVYTHIMASKKTEVEDIMHNYFSDVFPEK